MSSAVLVGGSGGIGAAVLEKLLARSVHTVVLGQTPPAHASDVEFTRFDLASTYALREISPEYTSKRFGDDPLNTLIINAGGATPRPLIHSDYDAFLAVVNLNLIAPALIVRAFLPQLQLGSPSRIVLVGSTAGRQGVANLAAYSSAKAGVLALSMSLARELSPKGIAVNCVVPGAVMTPSAAINRAELDRLAERPPGALEASMLTATGLGRLVSAQEVAHVIEWIALDAPAALTGQSVNVSALAQVW